MRMHIPAVTAAQMIEIDRLMTEEYGIQLVQMMENAGRSLAELARQMLGGEVTGRSIAVLCGSGNNGGGGLVAARHLSNWGAEILYELTSFPPKSRPVVAHQLNILASMGIRAMNDIELEKSDLVVDAMIGYGLQGDPRGAIVGLIRRANGSSRPILALDTPSGLDATSGIPGDPCIKATATMTLALPKAGLLTSSSRDHVGDLYLADISVPPALYAKLGIVPPAIFERETTVQILARQG